MKEGAAKHAGVSKTARTKGFLRSSETGDVFFVYLKNYAINEQAYL